MLCGNDTIGPAVFSRVGPTQDGRVVQAEPASDSADAAAFGDNALSGFHDRIMRYSHRSVNAESALSMRSSRLCEKRIADQIRSMTPEALKRALEMPGRSQSALARKLKIDQSAVNRMTKKGGRKIQLHELPLIEEYLRETESGVEPDLPPETDARADLDGVVMLPEYDVRLSAGPGFVVDAETTRREWPYPRFLIVDTLGIQPARATVQEVIGDSMEPTLSSGDYVVIDMADARIGLPGIFAVWDGDALVCKRVERIPGTDPRKVMLRSDNPLHGAYEVAEEDVRIIGRVRWITRRA